MMKVSENIDDHIHNAMISNLETLKKNYNFDT